MSKDKRELKLFPVVIEYDDYIPDSVYKNTIHAVTGAKGEQLEKSIEVLKSTGTLQLGNYIAEIAETKLEEILDISELDKCSISCYVM